MNPDRLEHERVGRRWFVPGSLMARYYDARATEYDDVWLRRGMFADRDSPEWHEEVEALVRLVCSLPSARTLDVGCGTGFLTRRLAGQTVGLDCSESMLAMARQNAPRVHLVCGDALHLPFEDGSFDRVFTSFFFGHLGPARVQRFLKEARRVASELLVVDAALRPDLPPVRWENRTLQDGSTWRIYKRYFSAADLAGELGGGDRLFKGHWFVAVRNSARAPRPTQ